MAHRKSNDGFRVKKSKGIVKTLFNVFRKRKGGQTPI